MINGYLTGVFLAIGSGVFFQLGSLFQKKAVNEVPPEERGKGFMRGLILKPVWLAGIACQFGVGSVLFILAQKMIGPALVPGLTSAGLLVLVVGSVKMLGETLTWREYLGVFLMIAGTTLLGFSNLSIPMESVAVLVSRADIRFRILVFTVIILILWAGLLIGSLRLTRRKGSVMALSGGFPYALMNFWVNLMIVGVIAFFGGQATSGIMVMTLVGVVIMVISNVGTVWQTQVIFKYAQATNAIPLQSIAVQVAPIFVYFAVFALRPGKALSTAFVIGGALLIIVSGFLLNRVESEMLAEEPKRQKNKYQNQE